MVTIIRLINQKKLNKKVIYMKQKVNIVLIYVETRKNVQRFGESKNVNIKPYYQE